MNILLVHNHYQQFGGERTAVEAQIALLRQNGHHVICYSKDNSSIQNYDLREKALFFPRTVFSRETYKQIKQLVLQERPNIAHIHNVFPLISPAIYYALNHAGVPIVQTVHNFRFLCPNSLFYTHGQICERCKHGNTLHAIKLRCYRDSYPLSALYAFSIGMHRRWGTFRMIDRFIALSDFVAQKLVESDLTTHEKITVLGNFLPDPLPSPGSLEIREPYVVYLGRLAPEKGVEVLLEAIAQLPGLTLKIGGVGPQEDVLREQVRRRELANVEFLGYLTGEQKWDVLRKALAVVVPSLWYEHFPFAVLESMAIGTAVVASRLGSLADLIEDRRNGLLFRYGDSDDLCVKLSELAEDPQDALAMGRYARETVERRFTETVHYAGLMRIYAELLH
jgi:glycosyltransferase involved in cell wall biosynthesis